MNRFPALLAIALTAGGSILADSATGQNPGTYRPETPTVSPWMGLWQQNTGALDNYHTYVQPQMELNAELQSQNAQLNRQGARLQALHNEVMQPQGVQPGMVPTGQGSTFMNYSHYFGGNRQAVRPPQRSNVSRSTPNMPSVPGVSQ
jgi:hypothetical protein